jgi:N-acetylneuraminate synthase/sialic acid synthase
VATRDLPEGAILTAGDIAFKSPGDGVAPFYLNFFIGKKLKAPVVEDAPLSFAAIGCSEADAKAAVDGR